MQSQFDVIGQFLHIYVASGLMLIETPFIMMRYIWTITADKTDFLIIPP